MTGRKTYISYIRAVACIGIVFLHTFTMCTVAFPDMIKEDSGTVFFLVPYLMMWAVPCFVMVTGALLLERSKDITYGKVFKKYIPRVLRALILCVIIFRFLDIWMNKESFSTAVFGDILKKLYTGKSWAHLWYLYLIIGLYLLMPAFKKITDNLETKELMILCVIYMIFVSVVPLLNDATEVTTGFYITTNSIFPAYLMIGHMIDSERVTVRRSVSVILTVIGFIGIAALEYYKAFTESEFVKNTLDKYLGSYAFIPVIILSIGVFSLFKNSASSEGKEKSGNNIIGRWLLSVDKCSFGVYLIHLVFLRYVFKCTEFKPYERNGVLMTTGLAVAVFVCSYLCVWIFNFIYKSIKGDKKKNEIKE